MPCPTVARNASTASSGRQPSTVVALTPGVGPSGSMCRRTSEADGTRAKVSISGSSARSSARIASAAASSPSTAPLIMASWRPRTGAGISSNGGSCRIRNDGRDRVRRVDGPAGPGAQDLLRVGAVPDQHPGVRRLDRVEPELQRGDHAEVAAAAADRPEQLGLGVRVGPDQPAVGGDDLDRGDAVGGQAELAGVPADAAAERVADDADVGRGAVQGGEPVRRDGLDDVDPQRAGTDPGGARGRVDRHLAHRGGADQHGVAQVAERTGVVTGALRGDPQTGGRGGADHLDDLVGVGRVGHRRRVLRDGDVPRHPSGVVPGVAGQVDGAAAEQAQTLGGGGGLGGHSWLLDGYAVRCLDRSRLRPAYLWGPWSPLAAVSLRQVRRPGADSAAPSSASRADAEPLADLGEGALDDGRGEEELLGDRAGRRAGRREPRDPPLGGRERHDVLERRAAASAPSAASSAAHLRGTARGSRTPRPAPARCRAAPPARPRRRSPGPAPARRRPARSARPTGRQQLVGLAEHLARTPSPPSSPAQRRVRPSTDGAPQCRASRTSSAIRSRASSTRPSAASTGAR